MRAAEVCTKNSESCSAPISIARWKLAEIIFIMAAPWNAQEILKSHFLLTDGAESTVLSTTVMLMGQRFPRAYILYQFNPGQGNALHWLHGAQIDPCTRGITCCVLRERTKSLPPYVQFSVDTQNINHRKPYRPTLTIYGEMGSQWCLRCSMQKVLGILLPRCHRHRTWEPDPQTASCSTWVSVFQTIAILST